MHDLHTWTITSGMNVVSAHVVLRRDGDPGAVLDHLVLCLSGNFDINHSTFQLETPDHVLWEAARSQARHWLLSSGYARLLQGGAYGNRRYCDAPKKEARLARAERNRRRRLTRPGVTMASPAAEKE